MPKYIFIILSIVASVFSQNLISSELTDLDSVFNKWQTTSDELTIKIADLKALDQGAEIIFVDIRAKREIKISKIPNAITVKEFEYRIQDPNYDLKGKVFVAYCTVGYRSGKFTEKYNSPKLKVLNLWGGILDWVRHGREIVDDSNEKTFEVHVYDRGWNFLPPKYKAVF